MIVVLADDLSGAAELAGAALAHGLSAEVQTKFEPASQATVICVDTDTRSLPADEAAQTVKEIATRVVTARPQWIYKKCDSVLRGNVLAELRAILAATGQTRATLLSANPSKGRIIRDGLYFVNSEPLHTTAFAHDPEHPRRTSRVAELLSGDLTGINTPDAETTADLERHAALMDANTLTAGGVEFFTALLRHLVIPVSTTHAAHSIPAGNASNGPKLMVCGSAAAWAKGRRAQAEQHGWVVETMPSKLLETPAGDLGSLSPWAERISSGLKCGRSIIAAIGQADLHPNPNALAQALAGTVAQALSETKVATVLAEGGATAAAVARALGWSRFAVGNQLAGGVVELVPMTDRAPRFIIKVGSYDWPENVWEG